MVLAGLLLASPLGVVPAASAATVAPTWSSPATNLSVSGRYYPQVALSADGTKATVVYSCRWTFHTYCYKFCY
jgi:hypothetical protein